MSSFPIYDGRPIPAEPKRERTAHYPWHKLQVGQCFFADVDAKGNPLAIGKLRSAANALGKKHNKQFRVVPGTSDEGVDGFLVFRIDAPAAPALAEAAE